VRIIIVFSHYYSYPASLSSAQQLLKISSRVISKSPGEKRMTRRGVDYIDYTEVSEDEGDTGRGPVVRHATFREVPDNTPKVAEIIGPYNWITGLAGKAEGVKSEFGRDSKSHQGSEVRNTSGDLYHGEIDEESGLPHGRGKISMANGDKYDGLMEMGRKKYGTVILTNGIDYTGDFIDEHPSGFGAIKWPSGHKYEGKHNKYVFEKGEYTFPDGERHEGKWSENVPDSEGLRKYVNGRRSIGNVQRVRMYHGRNIFRVWFTITKLVRVVEVWNGEEYTRESSQLIDKENLEHEDVFIEACVKGDFYRVRKILSKEPQLAQYAMANEAMKFAPAIVLAAENGHVEIVRLLLDKGADVGMVNNELENAVHVAVKGGHVEVVELLASRTVDYTSPLLDGGLPHPIDAPNKDGHVPFTIAALIQGMCVDGKQKDNIADITIVEKKQSEGSMRALMLHGANPGNVDAVPLVVDTKSLLASLFFFVSPSNDVIVQRYIRDYRSLPAKLTPKQRKMRAAETGIWCLLR